MTTKPSVAQELLASRSLLFYMSIRNDKNKCKVISSCIMFVTYTEKFATWYRRQYGNEHKSIWIL